MPFKICPTCKQPIIEGVLLPPIKQRIFDYVRKHPYRTSREILDHIYQDNPNGGPSSVNIVSAHVAQMNRLLKKDRLRMKATGGPGSTYYVESLK